MTSPNLVQGQLSLGSYIKLSVIGSIGILPVLAILYGMALLVSVARGATINLGGAGPVPVSELLHLWPLGLLLALAHVVSIVVSGVFLGLFSYPFYAWLCRRGKGVILRGKFEIIL
jgi:hypothetical protein